jgi:hypothetical protein
MKSLQGGKIKNGPLLTTYMVLCLYIEKKNQKSSYNSKDLEPLTALSIENFLKC